MSDSELVDPLGRKTTLHDRTWYAHILHGHPELESLRGLVENTVTNPDEIRYSISDGNCRIYYGSGPQERLSVAVVADVVLGIVKTAYLSRKISPGGVEWS